MYKIHNVAKMLKEKNLQRKKIILYMAEVIAVAMIIEVIILGFFNARNAGRANTLLLNQVVNILEANARDEAELVEDLKNEYMITAQTVAYILDEGAAVDPGMEELKKLTELMNIDEIHLFDETGTIYAGTVPQYYGYSFESGNQMAFFKPMLDDKSLSMCQDVTPNTAEGKSMMYAISWNRKGNVMVQVGIEPVRLLEKLKTNEITKVIDDIPTYSGMTVIATDDKKETIEASTDSSLVGKSLSEVGFTIEPGSASTVKNHTATIEGFRTTYKYTYVADKVILVSNSTRSNFENFMAACVIEFIYLLVAGLIIYHMLNRNLDVNDERKNQLTILLSMADIYYSMHLINLADNTAKKYSARNEVQEISDRDMKASEMMDLVIKTVITDEYREQALEFFAVETLSQRMTGKKLISGEFVGKRLGWFTASFITIEADEEGKPIKVMCVTRSIDDIKKKEETLIAQSNTDELTGLFNRRAYEDNIIEYKDTVTEENFVYVSIDVNGLKVANDTLGHHAGDELLIGASNCMKQCLGPYGRLFRTGGDEFVAIIFADNQELANVKRDFEEVVANWKGVHNDSLSVSCGYVTYKETGCTSVRELALIADKRMYAAKSDFYRKKGVDRRGQKEAHTALCAQYTKILKADITNDTYQIVNIDTKEMDEARGFSESISSWLVNFAKCGNVYEEDLPEYLAKANVEYIHNYFLENEAPLYIFYRRLFDGTYKRSVMEVIPASDYSDEEQTLFFYVKNLEA